MLLYGFIRLDAIFSWGLDSGLDLDPELRLYVTIFLQTVS